MTDDRSHHRVTGTLTALVYLQRLYHRTGFLCENDSYTLFYKSDYILKDMVPDNSYSFSGFFLLTHHRQRVDEADFSPEDLVTYLLSFSHGGGVSCGLARGPVLHSLLMLT